MNIEELEEALEEILPAGFQIETDNHGQLIIYTGLSQDDDGELVDFEGEEDEEDPDFDPDFEPIEEEDEDE
jgi:hypothetical protein